MFGYKFYKHPHFDEACRACALRHNMAKLAECGEINAAQQVEPRTAASAYTTLNLSAYRSH